MNNIMKRIYIYRLKYGDRIECTDLGRNTYGITLFPLDSKHCSLPAVLVSIEPHTHKGKS